MAEKTSGLSAEERAAVKQRAAELRAQEKAGKNRLHIDLRPDDQAAEVDRLVGLGAQRVDIGQGDVSWVVLADPEGNEFCVLSGGTPAAQTDPSA